MTKKEVVCKINKKSIVAVSYTHLDVYKRQPTACITIEDAELLNRMYDRGN